MRTKEEVAGHVAKKETPRHGAATAAVAAAEPTFTKTDPSGQHMGPA